MAEDKRIFSGGGMDMDTEERLIAPNDYRYALNCRVCRYCRKYEGQ